MPTIGSLTNWFFYGFIRYVVYWIPLLTPPSVDRAMPWQWLKYSSVWVWLQKGKNKGGPTEAWLQGWFSMVFGEAVLLVDIVTQPYVDQAKELLLSVIGAVSSNFSNLASWIGQVQDWFGLPLPWWSGTVNQGLTWLRDKLPTSIRGAWQTWDNIFDGIKDAVKNWVNASYAQARDWARGAFDWAVSAGQSLISWRDRIAGRIDSFLANPYGTITTWLGHTWQWLLGFQLYGRFIVFEWLGPDIYKALTFARDCSTFYYNLWSRGWSVLSDLVDDPVDYLYTRIEQMFVDRW